MGSVGGSGRIGRSRVYKDLAQLQRVGLYAIGSLQLSSLVS